MNTAPATVAPPAGMLPAPRLFAVYGMDMDAASKDALGVRGGGWPAMQQYAADLGAARPEYADSLDDILQHARAPFAFAERRTAAAAPLVSGVVPDGWVLYGSFARPLDDLWAGDVTRGGVLVQVSDRDRTSDEPFVVAHTYLACPEPLLPEQVQGFALNAVARA